MEREEIEGYEIYKNNPEAFTMPAIDEQEKTEALLYEALLYNYQQNGLPPGILWLQNHSKIRLHVVNDIDTTLRKSPGMGKNKGRKKRERGMAFAAKHGDYRNRDMTGTWNPVHIKIFLRELFPKGTIKRETMSNMYISCPFHATGEESRITRSSSLCISPKKGLVKCFECGKSHALSTFLSITMGDSRRHWDKKLSEVSSPERKSQDQITREAAQEDEDYRP